MNRTNKQNNNTVSNSSNSSSLGVGIRIQKYLSQKGILSRREAEKYMQMGLVKVNGKTVTELGSKVDPEKDKVEVIENSPKIVTKETWAINKPRGVITSTISTETGKNIADVFPNLKHLSPVGRLDKETEGLLLLSNDGIVTKKITGRNGGVEKEYVVTVREDVLPGMIEQIERGVKITDRITKPAKAEKIDQNNLKIILTEGSKHQIRRMCDSLKLTVENLKRVRVGNIKIENLQPGNSRRLSLIEVEELKNI